VNIIKNISSIYYYLITCSLNVVLVLLKEPDANSGERQLEKLSLGMAAN
jgi:hypothetical protein